MLYGADYKDFVALQESIPLTTGARISVMKASRDGEQRMLRVCRSAATAAVTCMCYSYGDISSRV